MFSRQKPLSDVLECLSIIMTVHYDKKGYGIRVFFYTTVVFMCTAEIIWNSISVWYKNTDLVFFLTDYIRFKSLLYVIRN